jgi:hypothetical protein
MRVPCPNGRNCPGSTPWEIQECFLARTARKMPYRVSRDIYGYVQGVLPNLLVEVAKALNDRYEIYQCSACGAEVAFELWLNRDGETNRRRIWDSVRGAQK